MVIIGNNWRVEADSLNVVLSQRKMRKKKTGETYEAWEVKGYFATVKGALHELVNQEVRDTKLKDFESVCKRIDKVHALIQEVALSP